MTVNDTYVDSECRQRDRGQHSTERIAPVSVALCEAGAAHLGRSPAPSKRQQNNLHLAKDIKIDQLTPT